MSTNKNVYFKVVTTKVVKATNKTEAAEAAKRVKPVRQSIDRVPAGVAAELKVNG